MTSVEPPRSIFLRWERLRIPYNALLTLVAIAFLVMLRDELQLSGPMTLVGKLLVGCVLANVCFTTVCFTTAPIVETYASWLGYRSRFVTPVLFTAGVLFSIPLVLLFVLAAFGWTIG